MNRILPYQVGWMNGGGTGQHIDENENSTWLEHGEHKEGKNKISVYLIF